MQKLDEINQLVMSDISSLPTSSDALINVHETISKHAQLNPSKIAITCDEQELKFSELDEKCTAIAIALQAKGVGCGDRVAILMDASINYIVAMLGVLKSGAAYIPLSSAHPIERIHAILGLADCTTLLHDQNNATIANNSSSNAFEIDQLYSFSGDIYASLKPSAPSDTACILFTSGSSGTPKGVLTSHANLAYYANWSGEFFKETVDNKLPLTSAMQFAAATSQIYSCLCAGQTLHILPNILNDPEKLIAWYKTHKDHALYCVPSVWAAVLKWLEREGMQSTIAPTTLFLSGEYVASSLYKKTRELFPSLPVWNLYGPTESVSNISTKLIENADNITIGHAITGSKLIVVNDDGLEADLNEEGRLLASGPGICSGYIGADSLNENCFFTFNSNLYGKIEVYDTGDIARQLEGGEFQFLGRHDQQVKLHGQRIELAEIENILLKHDDVLFAVVTLAHAPEPCLAAYIQAKNKTAIAVDVLRAHLRKHLPEIMLPTRWVFLDSFPKLLNGKLDRKSLPQPTNDRAQLAYDYVEPDCERSVKMVNIFSQILDLQQVGMNDSFFDLGGNSLKGFELLLEVDEHFHHRLDYKTLFSHPSPAMLLANIPLNTSAISNDFPSQEENVTTLPMTVAQQGLWLSMQAQPDNSSYNLMYNINISGELNVEGLEAALTKVCNRHMLMKSCIASGAGDAHFEVNSDYAFSLPFTSLLDEPEGERKAVLTTHLDELAATSFMASTAPLHRWHLFQINDNEYQLAFIAHHIIFDGISAGLLFQEMLSLYKENPVAELQTSFATSVARQVEYRNSDVFNEDKKFWQNYLNGVSEQPSFPVQYKTNDAQTFKAQQTNAIIDASMRARLSAISIERKQSLHTLLLSVFATTLNKFSADEYLIVAPFANRQDRAEQSLLGYFTNIVPYRLNCANFQSFAEFADNVGADTVKLLDHQQFPFAETVKILREQGANLPPSAFKLMFGYHDIAGWQAKAGLTSFDMQEYKNQHAKCDLHLECFDDQETIALKLTSDTSAIDEKSAQKLVDNFVQILDEILDNYDAEINSLAKISAQESSEILLASVGEKKTYAGDLTLENQYRQASDKHQNSEAIVFQNKSISYKELDNKIANTVSFISGLGLSPREAIGIYMDHTPEMVVSILACATMGHPYIPLDPTYPASRTLDIIKHAEIRHLLTNSDFSSFAVLTSLQCHFMDKISTDTVNNSSVANPPNPDDLLYIIYTSGSTGVPKGVMVPNKGVANYILWMRECFGTDENSRILAKTSISFDISVWELFLPLLSGGTLVLEKRVDIAAPEQMARIIQDRCVNILQFVPSGLKLFFDAGMLEQVPTVKKIFCGGELFPTNLEQQVLSSAYDGELHNLYGPTEASIFMSWHTCNDNVPYKNIPIGRPITNSSIYVLDKNLNLLPHNVCGDIYIGGEVLAHGYLKDQDKTQAAFIQAPAHLPEQIIYVTGDKGRLLSDGSFEYLGRTDHQVKIRGHRVELHEIEHVIESIATVGQAVAYVKHMGENDIRLHAIVVPNSKANISITAILAELRSKLPNYMVPASIFIVENVPLLGNGKIDYKKIDSLEIADTSVTIADPTLLETGKIETILFEIWSEVIGDSDFSLTDNFFEVGGHSVLFLKVRELIDERLGVNFNIADLYKSPNIKALADDYRSKKGALTPPKPPENIRKRIAKRKARLNGKR